MPFPFVALLPGLVAWGSRALAGYGLARLFSEEPVEELKQLVIGWIIEQAATQAGLNLDPADPFSDASMAGAVSQRIGVPLRSVKDRAMVEEDVDAYLAGIVSERSGYVVRSVRNVNMLKEDLQRTACAVLSDRLGLPAGVMPDDGEELNPALIRERLLTWAKAELYANVNEQVGLSVAEIIGAGDLEQVAAELNGQLYAMGAEHEVTARRLAVRVASMMATQAVTDYQRAAQGMSKRTRRQLQLRAAQAKFREAHGNRQKYVPLGWSVTVTEGEPD